MSSFKVVCVCVWYDCITVWVQMHVRVKRDQKESRENKREIAMWYITIVKEDGWMDVFIWVVHGGGKLQ